MSGYNPLAGCCTATGRHTTDLRLHHLDEPFSLWEHPDDSLRRLRRDYLRRAADLTEDGDLLHARREWYQAEELHQHQLMRFRLKMRYGAVFFGTDSYDCFLRHDEAPSYWLALFMDSTRARLGRRHTLAWPDATAAA